MADITIEQTLQNIEYVFEYLGESYTVEVVTNIVGEGGGAVDSVNGKIGIVVLNPDDLNDSTTTNKFTNQSDIDRLANTSGTNTGDQDISGIATNASAISTLEGNRLLEVQAGTNVTVDNTDPLRPIVNASGGGGGAVDSVNGETGIVVLDTDDIADTATNRYTNDIDIARLANTSGTNTGDQILPTNTSDLVNDGADGVNPFITAADIPADAVTSVNTQTGAVVLTTDDIADSATNRYTNDTDITRLANTSGTNTGDQDLSGLQPTLVSGTNIKTINGDSVLGSGNLVVTASAPVDSVNGQTGVVVLNEEDIVSTLIEPTILSGAYTFDVSTGRAFKFTITEATTLTPPTLENGTALSFTAIVDGDFTLTVNSVTLTPSSNTYDGTGLNRLIFDCYRTSAGVQTNVLTLENL